jgi:hypothetical protein
LKRRCNIVRARPIASASDTENPQAYQRIWTAGWPSRASPHRRDAGGRHFTFMKTITGAWLPLKSGLSFPFPASVAGISYGSPFSTLK